MRQEFSNAKRVPVSEAKRRALAHLDGVYPMTAASLADVIWPDHLMSAQGAGGAASRILKHLCDEGLAKWVCIGGPASRQAWGYVRCVSP